MNSVERQANNPEQLAADFLRQLQTAGIYERALIAQLAGLATSANAEDAQAATAAIFVSLVEKMADAFEPKLVLLYNRLFAQLIHCCCKLPDGEPLDRQLTNLGITTEEALVTRAEQLRHVRRFSRSEAAKRQVKRAIVLSRVTIGADVAITSVIVERLKGELPNAEIVLLGNLKAAELFGGEARLTFASISYQRGGALIERLLSWLEVLKRVRELTADLQPDEWIIVDPDSRLTQLGLLPLLPVEDLYKNQQTKASIPDQYLFFPSREIGGNTKQSLSELTSQWLNVMFGRAEPIFPQLHLRAEDRQIGNELTVRMCQDNSRRLVAMNFGVGDNALKRVAGDFESRLVSRFLQDGAKIIFDKGAGREEWQRAGQVISAAAQSSYRNRQINILEVEEANLSRLPDEAVKAADMLVWSGRLGLLAAMIAESDLYIGYDSAGQHIAAALAVPCIDVFAGYSSPRMLDRWQPTGKAASQVIAVDTLTDSQAILEKVFSFQFSVFSGR